MSPTLIVVSVYVVAGFTWILLSDRVVELFIRDVAQQQALQSLKGTAFVLATAALLYLLLSLRERQLASTEARLRLFIRHAPAALAMFDRDMRFLEVSDRWLKDFQLDSDDVIGRGHYEVLPETPAHWRAVHQRCLQGEVLSSEGEPFLRNDGRVQWQRWEARPWLDSTGAVGGIVIFAEDITQQHDADQELRISAKAFETRQPMMITDEKQRILRVNHPFCAVTGYEFHEVVGRTPALLQSGQHDAAFYAALWKELLDSGEWQGEIWNRRKNGEVYPEWLHISVVRNEGGEVTHYIAAFEDISQRKDAEAQIHALSYYDPLTRLPNRRLFQDRLQQALRSSDRSGLLGSVFFIDLDGFRSINDLRGHDVGDRVLLEVSRQLTAAMDVDDTVARLGSDEFVVLAEDLAANDDDAINRAREIGQRLLAAVRRPIAAIDESMVVTASMGVSILDGSRDSVAELMTRADAAMAQVKQIGRDCLHFFDHDMQQLLQERVNLEARLRSAIPHELRLHYQPQVNVEGHLLGVEALLRWEQPERGLLSPATFVPLAEESGLIVPIGEWVLAQASSQLARMQAMEHGARVSVSVNVSPRQFQLDDFAELVIDSLRNAQADPCGLVLEVTESILFDDLERVTLTMARLKEHGIRLSLDDFGTGFSSLRYLKSLPVDELKIDQSFVRGLCDDGDDGAIVDTIITLGRSLSVDVIAEGVENAAIRDDLLSRGCHRFQGYFVARPMPAEALMRRYFREEHEPRIENAAAAHGTGAP